MIDLLRDRLHLVPQRGGVLVRELEVAGLLTQTHNFLRDLHRTLAALGKVLTQDHLHTLSGNAFNQRTNFGIGVLRAMVDGHHRRQTELVVNVVDMPLQVDQPLLQGLDILLRQIRDRDATVILERPHGRHDHRRRRLQSGFAALDVNELLGAEVGTEARLRHHVVRELQRGFRRHHRVTPVGDVGERAAMNEGGIVLERLYEVRRQRLLQQHRHRAMRLQIPGENRLLVRGVAHHDLAEALLQIEEAVRQAEDRHDFGSHHDVETVLARIAVRRAAEPDDDVA